MELYARWLVRGHALPRIGIVSAGIPWRAGRRPDSIQRKCSGDEAPPDPRWRVTGRDPLVEGTRELRNCQCGSIQALYGRIEAAIRVQSDRFAYGQ
jgi:hypothetical protein